MSAMRVMTGAVSRVGNARARRAAFEITDNAAGRMRSLLSRKHPPPEGVRVSLKTRGCNGMAYTLNYVNQDEAQKYASDDVVEERGVKVYIDPRALMHIVGTQMDFVDTDIASEFVFHNPNAKGTCGCGESFSV